MSDKAISDSDIIEEIIKEIREEECEGLSKEEITEIQEEELRVSYGTAAAQIRVRSHNANDQSNKTVKH